MRHDYLDVMPVEKAGEIFFSAVKEAGFRCKTESVPSSEAAGRVLSQAVYAKICSPHYNASAMDGIAVLSSDTRGACEASPCTLSEELYTVVDTGDPLPDGCDAVIMAEDVTELSDGKVKIISAVSPWQNVRQTGEDICMGDMTAVSGTVVTPALCGAFLAGGVTNVSVIKRPVFGIIPTGDEIVPPTGDPGKGEIIEFNSTVFSAMLSEWGASAKVYGIVKDKKELLYAALEKAVSECDAVLILAGSSAGRDDYTCETVSRAGRVLVHGIAAKPGKPAVLGIAGSVPVAGLPGYPVSAIVVMEEFIRPLTDIWYRRAAKPVKTIKATLGRRVVSSLKYKEYVRVTLGKTADGYFAVPLPRGAGVITSLTKAGGILEIPQNSEGCEAGEEVEIRLIKDEAEIENALIITGSHDPLIDEAADILKKRGYPFAVLSSHVGSMGAITAVRAGQAHMGAVHLLDGETGEYNKSYIEKYFPSGGAVRVNGVGRIQGFMVAKGNPLGIKEFSDIVKGRYVNRQRGAGTRILCDFLLKKNGIAPADVNGYANEKFTHTAVAAFIASGSADIGMGIYSAAEMYGLDFIPLYDEEYDFLVDERYIGDEKVKAFIGILSDEEFIGRLNELGGYKIR